MAKRKSALRQRNSMAQAAKSGGEEEERKKAKSEEEKSAKISVSKYRKRPESVA